MQGVEERHGAERQLAVRVRLADPEKDREVGSDPEGQDRQQPEVIRPARRDIRLEPERQPRDEPEVSLG